MDTEPPDDGSMGGGNASERDTRQTRSARRNHMDLSKEKQFGYTDFFFSGLTLMFSASRFPSASAESTEKRVMRKVRPKTFWPSGLVRRAGAALQTHSGKEGSEKDKQCQDRNKVHQYLITVGVFFNLRSGAAEVNNYQTNTDGRLRVI